ncbi:uncharacterized protein [Embiotoca jacksoni]|uniref:uncharacterized protein n=1 Tax=Embiotoca jacksoni TaxID=100190 RepID=UPI0037039EA1
MAVSLLVSSLLLMMMVMIITKSDTIAVDVVTISATSGEPVRLQSHLLKDQTWDVRWTNPHLLLMKNRTVRQHQRCELLSDGSLAISRVQSRDSGNYTLEVFDKEGKLKRKKVFILRVEDTSTTAGGSGLIYNLLFLFLLLLFVIIIILFIMRRRRRVDRMTISAPKEENEYVVMQSHHGKKGEDEKKTGKEEEESAYVPCSPANFTEHEEDVYV